MLRGLPVYAKPLVSFWLLLKLAVAPGIRKVFRIMSRRGLGFNIGIIGKNQKLQNEYKPKHYYYELGNT